MDGNNLENQIKSLSHEDLCEITLSTLRRLVTSDKLLLDLPADVTNEELNAQIAVAQGQSITVTILRNNESPLQVVISQQKSTVYDLKKAIQRCFELKQQRSRSRSKISWKYIWKTYNLRNNDAEPGGDADYYGPVMSEDHQLVARHGVRNKSKISFVKRLRNCDNRYRNHRKRDRSVERYSRRDRSIERRDRSVERYDRRDRSVERRDRSVERFDRRDRSIERRDRSIERFDRRDRSIENRDISVEQHDKNDRNIETYDRFDRNYERRDKSIEKPPEVVKIPEKSYSKADPRLKNLLNQ